MSDRNWRAFWIKNPDCPDRRSPVFFKKFDARDIKSAELYISGVGFYVAELNGKRVGDQILAPAFTKYDTTVLYNVYDVSDLLTDGENELRVTLGNGWFNQAEDDAWKFNHSPWRALPKMICELFINGECAVISDSSWECADGRYIYNSLRCGQTYDASAELTNLHHAVVSFGPGGILKKQNSPAIKISEVLEPVGLVPCQSQTVYDFGVSLSGNVEIAVRGKRGARVTLRYGERVHDPDGAIDLHDISLCVHNHRFQEDVYILSGEGTERWYGEFAYNGFRYVQVEMEGEAELVDIKARCFHTELPSAGSFEIDHPVMNAVQKAILRSTRTNFHHMPTDCPHREKNGWTGDAHLSCEQALFNFDMKDAYIKWLDDIVDCQRPNGQIPCIVPTEAWGYGWGTGVTWDAVICEIPYQIYMYTGDKAVLECYIVPMRRYIDFMLRMSDTGIWHHGLGDWCPPKEAQTVSDDTLLTAYAYFCMDRYRSCAAALGMTDDAKWAEEHALGIKETIRREIIGKERDSQTYLAILLAFGLTDDPSDTLGRLEKQLEADGFHTTSGIFGTKLIFNALTDAGRFDLAWKLATVEGYPGYSYLLTLGSGTLSEEWGGGTSRNHHMFSSIGDWFYKGIAGIHLDENAPGFKHIDLRPHIPQGCKAFSARHSTPLGELSVEWTAPTLTVKLPDDCSASVTFGALSEEWHGGVHTVTLDAE